MESGRKKPIKILQKERFKRVSNNFAQKKGYKNWEDFKKSNPTSSFTDFFEEFFEMYLDDLKKNSGDHLILVKKKSFN